MTDEDAIAAPLERARSLAAKGEDEAAKSAYLEVLGRDPTHFTALNNLGTLAYASGHRSAARTAYAQAVRCHPGNPMGRVNLANLLYENGEFEPARAHFEAALAAAPDFAEAHQGMARLLAALGETAAAAPHLQKGFAGHAIVTQPYRGTVPPLEVLLLVSALGGNVPTRVLLDDQVFAVSALFTEFYQPELPLPPHALVMNAIGDADLCGAALEAADEVLKRSTAPVVNKPASVRATGRAANAERLADVPGVTAPLVVSVPRAAVVNSEAVRRVGFPLLLRAPGFHTGRYFLRVEREAELGLAVAQLPGDELLAIQYLDARGGDGMARKYRAMMVDGAHYPLHLAIAPDWKVHYFTADMAANTLHRDEERKFLDDMPGVLGPRAMAALAGIGAILGLDYAGVDFGLALDGSVLLFEANATMVINPPEPDARWDYRRAAVARVQSAVKRMLLARARRSL